MACILLLLKFFGVCVSPAPRHELFSRDCSAFLHAIAQRLSGDVPRPAPRILSSTVKRFTQNLAFCLPLRLLQTTTSTWRVLHSYESSHFPATASSANKSHDASVEIFLYRCNVLCGVFLLDVSPQCKFSPRADAAVGMALVSLQPFQTKWIFPVNSWCGSGVLVLHFGVSPAKFTLAAVFPLTNLIYSSRIIFFHIHVHSAPGNLPLRSAPLQVFCSW
eukprot:Gb_14170 [translate_table: standard]